MIPADQLTSTPVFHMTHVENVVGVIEEGELLAKNFLEDGAEISIANEEVQSRRESKTVGAGAGGVLHDYVPFYFAPRAPMLYCNHNRSITNARPQRDIAYLVTTAQALAADLDFVFYDRHAVLAYAECFDDLAHLNQIDWRIFFEPPLIGGYAKYWQDRNDPDNPHWGSRREVRQAEFLAHRAVPISLIHEIVVYDAAAKASIANSLQSAGSRLTVSINPYWYF